MEFCALIADGREGPGHHIFAFLGHFLTYFGSHKNTGVWRAGQHLLHIILTFLRHSNFIEECSQKCQCFDLHLLLFDQLSVRKRSEAFLREKKLGKNTKNDCHLSSDLYSRQSI